MFAPVLQTTTEQAAEVGAQLLGLAALAGTLAALVALCYRWVARERVPAALALLVGLSGVAIYLNTTTALGRAIGGDMVATELPVALFNVGAFLAGGIGAAAGGRAGDRFGTEVVLDDGTSDVDEEVGRLVKTVGRVITVAVPEEIDDVVGYDPVPAATKETLAGKTFVFPRNLTVDELHRRLVSRLKTDYGVGTADVELGTDGSVEYLAVGSRAAGIGPTLPPATNAVAIRADPAFSASTGDVVQVWETDPMRRVLTAELRGVAGDVVTVAIDASDTPKLDPRRQYRLVTLPVEDRPEREFASLLRAADETFSTATVEAGSPLHGMPVGALDLAVVAVRPDGEGAAPVALPGDDEILSPGDTVFAIARPEAFRRLETAAEPIDPALIGVADRRPTTGEEPDDADWADDEADLDGADPDVDDADEVELIDLGDDDSELDDALSLDDELDEFGDEADDDSEQADEEREGADDEDDGGGKSFAELKEEFESGDADWEDDVDDSPGGDMRLDE